MPDTPQSRFRTYASATLRAHSVLRRHRGADYARPAEACTTQNANVSLGHEERNSTVPIQRAAPLSRGRCLVQSQVSCRGRHNVLRRVLHQTGTPGRCATCAMAAPSCSQPHRRSRLQVECGYGMPVLDDTVTNGRGGRKGILHRTLLNSGGDLRRSESQLFMRGSRRDGAPSRRNTRWLRTRLADFQGGEISAAQRRR